MKWIWFCSVVALTMVMTGHLVAASEAVRVAWQTDVKNAWQATQQEGRFLLVFVTRDNCFYCTQMKDRTYANEVVAGAIRSSFVPLVLDGGLPSALLKELNVTSFPSTFVISPQAVIVDRIDGYVDPHVMASRLNALRGHTPVARVVKDP